MKQAYISPPAGLLDVTIIRDNDPRVVITLDLGIPNFTVFSLKMPVLEQPGSMTELLSEALSALLDEMSCFMLSLAFDEKVIVAIYAMVLATFKEMTSDSKTDASQSQVGRDDTVVTYEGSFQLPQPFVDETHRKVVTGSRVLKRVPKVRRVELTVEKPQKVQKEDLGRVIRQYRNRSLKTQPRNLFMVVYDQQGRPAGTVPMGAKFRNNLLKLRSSQQASTPQFTDPATFERLNELLYKNVVGIPKSISVEENEFLPEAFCGDDMALYADRTHRYLVKFPDGRVVKFHNRPSVRALRNRNYPVPSEYWRWNLIKKDEVPDPADEISFSEVEENPELEENTNEKTSAKLCSQCHIRAEWRDGLCHKCLEKQKTGVADAGGGWKKDTQTEIALETGEKSSIDSI